MLASAFALTNCSEEFVQQIETPETDQVVGVIPFEIYASALQTKTANDGMSTVRVENDQINVFHAEAGAASYVNDGVFAIYKQNLADGLFQGSLKQPLTASAYDWYFFYPYTVGMKTPAGDAVVTLAGKTQTQKGNSNMAHIAGVNYPMCAVVENVAAGETPTGMMKHMTALVAINVINNTGAAMTVTSAGLKAAEELVGAFKVDFAGNEVVYTPAEGSSNKAELQVLEGESIAAGASAKFYLAVKPFTAEAESRLTVYVNGNQKSISLTEVTEFQAGKIKTINVTVDPLQHPTSTSDVIKNENLKVGDNTTASHRAVINGVDTRYVVVMGTPEKTGSVVLKGSIEEFIIMTELGFYAASWTGKQGALAVDNVVLDIHRDLLVTMALASIFMDHPVLKYFVNNTNPYELTPAELAEMMGAEVDMDRFMFKPAPAGVFVEGSTSHNLTILDEDLHYYGITENEVDSLLSGSGLGISVADLRAILNKEADVAAIIKDKGIWSKLEPKVSSMLTFDQFVEMVDNAIKPFVQTEVHVTLKTVSTDQAGNTYDPRIVIWGMNIYLN